MKFYIHEIIEEKNPNLENKEEVARKVGVGAVIFNDLSNNRIKDEIFDWDMLLNFQGETGPYIQYMYVRTNSLIKKAGYMPKMSDIDFKKLADKESINIISLLYSFGEIVKDAGNNNEPSIISRYLLELAKNYSNFYNEHKIICEDKKEQDARLAITLAVQIVLKTGCTLLGMEMPEEM